MEDYKTIVYDKGGKSITVQLFEGYALPYPLPVKDVGEHLHSIRNMPSRPDDVLIASYPKSGTHWLLEAIHMLHTCSSEYLGRDHPNPTGGPDGFPELEFIHMDKFKFVQSPRLMTSHLRPQYIPNNFKGKIIYLTRNPKDVAVSYYRYCVRSQYIGYGGEWEDFLHLFMDGKVIMGAPFTYWREWRDFKAEHPEYTILYVTYEDLHQDFISALKRISDFLNVEATDSFLREIHERCNISNIRQSRLDKPEASKEYYFSKERDQQDKSENDNYLYRKGVVGDWKNWFTVAQSEIFDVAFAREMNS